MDGAADLLGFHARFRANKVVAIDLTRNRQWTYAELDLSCGQYAAALKKSWRPARRSHRLSSQKPCRANCAASCLRPNWCHLCAD